MYSLSCQNLLELDVIMNYVIVEKYLLPWKHIYLHQYNLYKSNLVVSWVRPVCDGLLAMLYPERDRLLVILGLFFLPKNCSQNGTGERIGRFHWVIPPKDWLIECGHMTASIYYEGLQHHAELSEIHISELRYDFDLLPFENIHNLYTCESTRLGHWTRDRVLAKIWPWTSTLLLVTAFNLIGYSCITTEHKNQKKQILLIFCLLPEKNQRS